MGRTDTYPEEFRQQAVALVRETNRPLAQIARELGMNSSTLSNWVNAERRAGLGPPPSPQALSEAEREELRRLRRENAQLKTEREILKKAAAFFVQESTR